MPERSSAPNARELFAALVGQPRAPETSLEPGVTFVVRAHDGSVVDTFREDELATWEGESGKGKTWHEAACWATVAIERDKRERGRTT